MWKSKRFYGGFRCRRRKDALMYCSLLSEQIVKSNWIKNNKQEGIKKMKQDMIVILDLGSTENTVLARQIRALGVYSEIYPHDITAEELKKLPNVKGIIIYGGPNHIVDGEEIDVNAEIYEAGYPVMAVAHEKALCETKLEAFPTCEEETMELLKKFVFDTCHAEANWNMKNFIEDQVELIRKQVGDKKVLLALSGGVDSSVVAAMLIKAIGQQLVCVHVNHGLMRKNESESVVKIFRDELHANLIYVDATERFLGKLENVADPEEKRKIIGGEFIRVFEEEARKLEGIDFLGQGTIYPDVIESGLGDSAVIKSHHNVGGLPSVVDFKELIEPLRLLFKDEVRQMGTELGLPDYIVWRQPFPGPGLGIRVIGEVTEDKLEILREADAIFREEIKNAGLERDINQYFAVITDIRSVGVMGDGRTYDYTIALRGVTTTDFMTADWARIPYDVLDRVSVRIVNEVKHVNRICYDITSKPPATIEWE